MASTEIDCKSKLTLDQALNALDEVAPAFPILALGQTVFWDEPMKAGVALAVKGRTPKRRFIAGVHDTDYFAKLPSAKRGPNRFRMVPHNDTSTKGLWSAAAEFSTLFGSETVVTREALHAAGARLESLQRKFPGFLDEATEAWGWRGLVAESGDPPLSVDLPVAHIQQALFEILDWALDGAVDCAVGATREAARAKADEIRTAVCDALIATEASAAPTLANLYRKLLPTMYSAPAAEPVDLETTQTSELLRFNLDTCRLPRFELLERFIHPETKAAACEAYDEAVGESEIYALSRFGTGALPFDLVVPGQGRGTLRLGTHGLIVMTRTPMFVTLKRPIRTLEDLAAAIESRFGRNCALIGKAVTLVPMLAREFTFAFHEGASSYVKSSRRMMSLLEQSGIGMSLSPILRIRLNLWDALQNVHSWLRLPDPLRRPFGTEEMCGPSFAQRWRQVGHEQRALLAELSALRRPIELIQYLDRSVGGGWRAIAAEYEGLHNELSSASERIERVRQKRIELYPILHAARKRLVDSEVEKGRHFRACIFEKQPSPDDWAERERLTEQVERCRKRVAELTSQIRHLRHEQAVVAQDPQAQAAHQRRRSIELEAEAKRVRMVKMAILASKGLESANLRPSAWWLALFSPDGAWFRSVVESAECYLEPLSE